MIRQLYYRGKLGGRWKIKPSPLSFKRHNRCLFPRRPRWVLCFQLSYSNSHQLCPTNRFLLVTLSVLLEEKKRRIGARWKNSASRSCLVCLFVFSVCFASVLRKEAQNNLPVSLRTGCQVERVEKERSLEEKKKAPFFLPQATLFFAPLVWSTHFSLKEISLSCSCFLPSVLLGTFWNQLNIAFLVF